MEKRKRKKNLRTTKQSNLKTFREAIGETDFKPSVKAWLFLRLDEIENQLRQHRRNIKECPFSEFEEWDAALLYMIKEILGE